MKKPIQPFLGNPPIAPTEYFNKEVEISLPLEKSFSLKEVEDYIPDNITLEDLRFIYRCFSSNEYDYDHHMVVYYLVRELNPIYKKQLKKYEVDCKIYEEKKIKYDNDFLQYKKDLKDYENYLKETELKKLKKRLLQLEKDDKK